MHCEFLKGRELLPHFLNSLDHGMEYFIGLASPRTHCGTGWLSTYGVAGWPSLLLCVRGDVSHPGPLARGFAFQVTRKWSDCQWFSSTLDVAKRRTDYLEKHHPIERESLAQYVSRSGGPQTRDPWRKFRCSVNLDKKENCVFIFINLWPKFSISYGYECGNRPQSYEQNLWLCQQ